MSTISPFVRIEGSINQPRSRAADSFPPPFGAEWALLSPEGSLRADLSALLRTFCLHDETIWSMCHWSSAWPRQPAVHLAEPASPFAMPPGEREHAQASAMPVAKDAPAMSLRGGFPPGVRVAGACAMGGAALLAWLAIGHLPQRHTEPGSASVLHAQPANDASGTARSSIAMPDEVPVQTHAPIALQPHLDEARHARHGIHEANRAIHRKAHSSASQSVTAKRHAGAAAASSGLHRPASSAVHRRPWARPSAAGGYSPFAPARLGSDEYASVTMPAEARLRDALLTPPAMHRGTSSDAEWMSHISQRRVTEVPDEFGK
jgi:hypothetical protein